MRIVGGTLRGRQITGPQHEGLRPTADRVRESLFNLLAHGPYGDPKPMAQPVHKPVHKPARKAKKAEGLPLVGELPLVGGLSGLADTVTGLADNLVGSAAKSQINGGGLLGGAGMGGHRVGGDGQCLSATTSGNFGILNGTQAVAVVQAPIDISGNAVGVAGDATAWSTGGAVATLTC